VLPADAIGSGRPRGPRRRGPRKLEIAVTDKGFEPDKVAVKKGEPVQLVFTRPGP
jgi:plastocyanin domain-containing protein